MRSMLLGLGLPLLVLLAGCHDDDSSSPPAAATGSIGPEGGTIQVTSGPLAGTSLTIPPGALTGPVAFSIFEDQLSLVPGFVDVGPAVHIEPSLTLAVPALLILPFDPARVPAPTTTGDYVVRTRDSTGMVSDGPPRHVETAAGRVAVDALQMLTWWVSVPDAIDTRAYLPLGGGDAYRYDNSLILTVEATRTEPNFLGLPITKLTFNSLSFYAGFYLTEEGGGALNLFGEFEVAFTNRQERLASAVRLLDPVEVVGSEHEAYYSFTGFVPYGFAVPSYNGSAHMTAATVQHTSVGTPLGVFDDVVLFEVVIERSDSRPQYGTTTLRLWCAKGVGPVQVQFGETPPFRLHAAVVGGVPVGQ